ncbi:MAG: UDP-N-acetylglucosamine 1-carboxyvinyltransferase [Candidatus Omnitrophica bacterium]|nr:UDP-N-acetylglucosamine 1-carboxyvinyltransferase [Candidatus Omnitrophota bacterium]
MDKLIIEGAKPLKGTVTISGAKNSCLPILAATLLTDDKCVIKNVPSLGDVFTMLKIMRALGIDTAMKDGVITVKPTTRRNFTAPYELVSTMRASVCVLGPLLAKMKRAEVSFPGGCVIGPRPIDLHLKGIKSLGARLDVKEGYIVAESKRLRGNHVYLGGHFGSSVLATANVMMAATLARGRTVIENAACEPEIVDLAHFLKKMGAKIENIATHRIEIEGVKSLKGVTHHVIPDRIETGTFIIASGITRGDITIKNARPDHLNCVIDKLRESGLSIDTSKNTIKVKYKKPLRPMDITTLPYPGFPTDLQAQMMSLMAVTEGISVVTEKIYPERFIHISELNRMGVDIKLEGPTAIVKGMKKRPSGARVMASDLRASAALVLAGLVAKGKTEISRIYHLDRGYEKIEKKLVSLGAKIWREHE